MLQVYKCILLFILAMPLVSGCGGVRSSIHFYDTANWTPDNKLIVVRRIEEYESSGSMWVGSKLISRQVYFSRMDFDLSNETTLFNVDSESIISELSVSPNGDKLTYISDNKLYSSTPNGENTIQLTDDDEKIVHHCWSGDNSRIFYEKEVSPTNEVWIINVETKAKYLLQAAIGGYDYAWRGEKIMFMKYNNDASYLMQISPEGSSIEVTPIKNVSYPQYLYGTNYLIAFDYDGNLLRYNLLDGSLVEQNSIPISRWATKIVSPDGNKIIGLLNDNPRQPIYYLCNYDGSNYAIIKNQ